MAQDALYIIAVWILAGMSFGMLATGYGACRQIYRLWPGFRELLDWLWFVVVGGAFIVILFWTEWGTFRLWSLVFVMIGYGLWTWLAAPVMLGMLLAVGHAEARVIHQVLAPERWLIRVVESRYSRIKKRPPKE